MGQVAHRDHTVLCAPQGDERVSDSAIGSGKGNRGGEAARYKGEMMGLFKKRPPSQWELEQKRKQDAKDAFRQKVRDGLVIEQPGLGSPHDRYHCDPRTGIVTFCEPASKGWVTVQECYIAASAEGHYNGESPAQRMSEDVEAMQGHFARSVAESGMPVAAGHYVAHLFDPRAPDTLHHVSSHMSFLQPGTLVYVYEKRWVFRLTSRRDRYEYISGELPSAIQRIVDSGELVYGGTLRQELESGGGRLEYPTAAEPPFIVNWHGGQLLDQRHVRRARMPQPPRPRQGLLD